MTTRGAVPNWETLLAHAAALQTKVPGAVLVGATAAAVHARHRFSVRRSAPLETTNIVVADGARRLIPTVEEMLRIKSFLVVDRNATRDGPYKSNVVHSPLRCRATEP